MLRVVHGWVGNVAPLPEERVRHHEAVFPCEAARFLLHLDRHDAEEGRILQHACRYPLSVVGGQTTRR